MFLSKRYTLKICTQVHVSRDLTSEGAFLLLFPLYIFGRTYDTCVYVHESLEEERRIINESGSRTLRPPNLLP